ncbi:MAG TPA: SH3 domain-containing protein, partial [Chloroflexota bacterium]
MLRRVSGRGLVGRIAGAALLALVTSAIGIGIALADGVRVGSEAEVVSDDGLNLRARPDYGASVIGTVKGGHIVFVIDGPEQGADGAWYKVDYDGDVGWVLGGYLGPARPRELSSRGNAVGRGDDEGAGSTAARANAGGGVRVGSEAEVDPSDGVNLRSSPATDARIVTVINQSKYVYIVDGPEQGPDGTWYKVDYDGDLGWVLGTFLSPARPRQAPPARREESPAPSAQRGAPRPVSPPTAAPVDPP